jgi:hypothetical protein
MGQIHESAGKGPAKPVKAKCGSVMAIAGIVDIR